MTEGGGSGFCEESCDLQPALSIARGMVSHPPWTDFPGLSSHLSGWLYERGEFCTVQEGRTVVILVVMGMHVLGLVESQQQQVSYAVVYHPQPVPLKRMSSPLLFCADSEMLEL